MRMSTGSLCGRISVFLCLCILTGSLTVAAFEWETPWTFSCVLDTIDGPACQRSEFNRTQGQERTPLGSCLLTCGDYGSLWPYPTGKTRLGRSLTAFSLPGVDLVNISAPSTEIENRLKIAGDILGVNVEKIPLGEVRSDNPNVVEVYVTVTSGANRVTFDLDESYSLKINKTQGANYTVVQAFIDAPTFFGARHGLETLSQLIAYNEDLQLLQIVDDVEIEDKPKFAYRGLLLDTARNFYPMEDLKRLMDGLSYNKLNVFHWHLTDSNSYQLVSKRLPQVTRYGIFSPDKVYTNENILELIEYAKQRGIKVIPELDGPAHAGNGWQWGPQEGLGDLVVCANAQPYKAYCIQPPCGQLNPLNNNTLFVLGELFKDFLDVFDRDFLHMGGDEISERCWLSYAPILEWLAMNPNKTLMDLWGSYQERALAKLKEANQGQPIKAIVWTSAMTDHDNARRQFLNPEDYIIQIWSTSTDPVIKDILNENYTVIFSHNDTMYLDHGFGAWRGTQNKATLKSWQDVYGTDILDVPTKVMGVERVQRMVDEGQILGGEATLWSEKTDIQNMDMKMWPRGSALAERVWSSPPKSRTRFAYPRLINHRERLVLRGIRADTLLPESCYQTWGFCDDPDPAPKSK